MTVVRQRVRAPQIRARELRRLRTELYNRRQLEIALDPQIEIAPMIETLQMQINATRRSNLAPSEKARRIRSFQEQIARLNRIEGFR